MGDLDLTKLERDTVLVLENTPESQDKDLPSPVLYLGLVSISGNTEDQGFAAVSDAFKRAVLDTSGERHMLTDVTISTLYREVTGEEHQWLLAQHWPQR